MTSLKELVPPLDSSSLEPVYFLGLIENCSSAVELQSGEDPALLQRDFILIDGPNQVSLIILSSFISFIFIQFYLFFPFLYSGQLINYRSDAFGSCAPRKSSLAALLPSCSTRRSSQRGRWQLICPSSERIRWFGGNF